MEISLSLLIFSFLVSNSFVHCVNSDPNYGYGVTDYWDGIIGGGHGGGKVKPTKPKSAATNQLDIWASNNGTNSYYHGPSRATNLHGIPLPSLTATQAVGTSSHAVLDFVLIEKLASFNRERIPERVVHAKGAGAHGHFEVTHDISKYTKAKFLSVGKTTRVVTRFSTNGGERGSADTAVDPNGFAVKFFTEDGNHDLVGLNIEAFPIRDPMLFIDLNRSRKRNPQTHLKDANMFWDFVSLRPETTLSTLHVLSDIGRADGYRKMDGYGVHAFKLVNIHDEVVFCKFHWRTNQPGPAQTYQQAAELAGTNPDYKVQDLYDAIARGDFPSWNLYIQVMTVEDVKAYPRNPFDATRTWREEEFPLIPVGKMTLNRNPSNYYVEVEQAGFAPNNMVPGIEASPDRLLAGRLFAYQDALRYRLGVNWPHLPINRPVVEVNSYMRDGQGCYSNNGGGSPNYFPNSFGGSVADIGGAGQVRFELKGVVGRFDIPEDEHLESRWFLERDVDAAHRRRLVESIAVLLQGAKLEIRERVLKNNFYPISTAFGDEVREAVQRLLENRNDGGNNVKSMTARSGNNYINNDWQIVRSY